MYADDTAIYFNLKEFEYLNKERDINSELEKVNTWLKLNKQSLNAQKNILTENKNMLMKSMFRLIVQRSNVKNH